MKHQQERIAETYLMLRDALRQLRGNGLFRGNECYIQHLNQLRLPFEHRGNALNHREYVLHLTPEADALWAERLPDHHHLSVMDFGGDWLAWLTAIATECRGEAYLHTNSKTADYRQQHILVGPQDKGHPQQPQ